MFKRGNKKAKKHRNMQVRNMFQGEHKFEKKILHGDTL